MQKRGGGERERGRGRTRGGKRSGEGIKTKEGGGE